MNNKILFQEKQKFTQWWLWLFLLGTTLSVSYYTVKSNTVSKIIENENLNPNPDSFTQVLREEYITFDLMTILLLISPLLLIVLLFLVLRLETIVSHDCVRMRYFPFLKRTFKWSNIESAEIIKYGFVGYGIRLSTKYGTMYNVKGSQGLALTLKNGKKYLIGTQKPEELQRLVKEILD